MCVDELVNVTVYVDLTNADVTELQTKYGPKKKKMDVLVYVDTFDGMVKLVLWNNYTTVISESGVYKLQDLRIKSYNGKYLTTISEQKSRSPMTRFLKELSML